MGGNYGTSEARAGALSTAPTTPLMHEDFVTVLELTDLSPATRYYYEVTVNGEVVREGLSFQTAPGGPGQAIARRAEGPAGAVQGAGHSDAGRKGRLGWGSHRWGTSPLSFLLFWV